MARTFCLYKTLSSKAKTTTNWPILRVAGCRCIRARKRGSAEPACTPAGTIQAVSAVSRAACTNLRTIGRRSPYVGQVLFLFFLQSKNCWIILFLPYKSQRIRNQINKRIFISLLKGCSKSHFSLMKFCALSPTGSYLWTGWKIFSVNTLKH